jgi:hypothetical protein
MSYQFKSDDGLLQSNDATAVESWNASSARMADETAQATERLRAEGVTAAHPDDGWVDRTRSCVQFVYPQFNDGVSVGDLIALGWEWKSYRLVRVTRIEERHGRTKHYYFVPVASGDGENP